MKKKLVTFPIIICFLLALGCEHKSEKFISEGRIEYNVKVLNGEGNMMAEMIPNKMIFKFKNNKSCATMSAEMGLFSASFIANPETNTNTICMKLLTKKMVAIQNTFDIERENDQYQYDFFPTEETKMIAGYKCYKVHVKPRKKGEAEFDVFYTKELDFKNPNFANPFNKIDGVLMEYQIKKLAFELRFTATAVIPEDVEDEDFTYTSDHKRISNKEMNDIFKDLQ
ncbi:MAG TPA: hypothetical protein VFF27_18405 [Bacteroidia bacterium]|jgi:hypothetical protein|nr:hypothetical protein [Bacteroidia bacterium]